MLALTLVATKPAIALPTLEKLSHPAISQQAVIGGGIVAFSFVLFLFLLLQLSRRKHAPKPKPQEQPDLHLHIKELQKALVKEMQATSRQNNIMILLTVAFIFITLFGGTIVLVLSKVPNFFGDLGSFLKSFLGR